MTRFNTWAIERHRIFIDGDGITTIVAGMNCPLRCKYCINAACFNPETRGRSYSVEELIDVLMIDDLYFKATNGGVMFGGGEPLLQAEFIHEFRQSCPPEWKVYVETSLAVPQEKLDQIIHDVDFFIVDIKDMNPEIYKAYTGKSNEKTISNLRHLLEVRGPECMKVRVPLIKDYNQKSDQENSCKILQDMGVIQLEKFSYVLSYPK